MTPEAAASVATRTEFGADIGGAQTIADLRALWIMLRDRHATLLGGMRPVIAIQQRGGTVQLRLVVGPLDNASAAARLCGELAAGGLVCQPALFDGQRLALR